MMRNLDATAHPDDDDEHGAARGSGPFPLPPGARLEPDLPYGDDDRQRLDVYHPREATSAPLVLMVHGGGWSRGDKAHWRVVRNKVWHWVSKGCIFVSTNHRLAPAADPLAQAEDIAMALAFVQSRLRAWGGDAARLVVMGHSAGAHLAALLTADPVITVRHGAAPWLATVMLDSAAMDVERIMRAPHPPLYDLAFGDDPDYWRKSSPLQRLASTPVAPMLVICSSRRPGANLQARALAARAAQFGGRVEVLPVDLSHAEINETLGLRNGYTERVDAFLETVGVD